MLDTPRRPVTWLFVLVVLVAGAGAQVPRFEVASVRPAAPPASFADARPIRATPGGQLTGNAPLRDWISWAYALAPYQPVEGSADVLDQWFAISARADGEPRLSGRREIGPFNVMLQALLAERFALEVRWQNRSERVSLLRLVRPGQLGRGVKRVDVDCSSVGASSNRALRRVCAGGVGIINGEMTASVRRLSDFAHALSAMTLRPIIDDTGLVGPFELTMSFDPATLETRRPSPFPPAALDRLPAFNDALRDELGMTLAPERRDIPFLVVEQVAPPTPN